MKMALKFHYVTQFCYGVLLILAGLTLLHLSNATFDIAISILAITGGAMVITHRDDPTVMATKFDTIQAVIILSVSLIVWPLYITDLQSAAFLISGLSITTTGILVRNRLTHLINDNGMGQI